MASKNSTDTASVREVCSLSLVQEELCRHAVDCLAGVSVELGDDISCISGRQR